MLFSKDGLQLCAGPCFAAWQCHDSPGPRLLSLLREVPRHQSSIWGSVRVPLKSLTGDGWTGPQGTPGQLKINNMFEYLPRERQEPKRSLTSSMTTHICFTHWMMASGVPEIVTARSVEFGSISPATCTWAPVDLSRRKPEYHYQEGNARRGEGRGGEEAKIILGIISQKSWKTFSQQKKSPHAFHIEFALPHITNKMFSWLLLKCYVCIYLVSF